MGNTSAQNLNSSTNKFDNRRIIDNKKFHVQYEELVIDKTIDEVWEEVAINFTKGGEIAFDIKKVTCLSGDVKSGLGAIRVLDLIFEGKSIQAKETIIEFKEQGDNREYTYQVESEDSPIKITSYFTWVVRKAENGKTYLGTYFIYRTKFWLLTKIVGRKIAKSGSLRTGLLSYKHFLETGEKKLEGKKLNELYPVN